MSTHPENYVPAQKFAKAFGKFYNTYKFEDGLEFSLGSYVDIVDDENGAYLLFKEDDYVGEVKVPYLPKGDYFDFSYKWPLTKEELNTL